MRPIPDDVRNRAVLWTAVFLSAALRLSAESPGAELFEKKIRPVLATNCYGCHSSKQKSPMGELVLDTKAGLAKGGASGPVVKPGKPSASLLVRALHYTDLRLKMPPTGKLSDSVIADFEQWIATGAEDPRPDSGVPSAPSTARVIDFEQGRTWWSLRQVKESPAPPVKNAAWPQAKIDFFLLAALEEWIEALAGSGCKGPGPARLS